MNGKNGEKHKFIQSLEFRKMLRKTKKRLGLKKKLSYKNGFAMWKICAQQQATYENSPWCSVSCKHFVYEIPTQA